MAHSNQEEYRRKLRQRSASTPTGSNTPQSAQPSINIATLKEMEPPKGELVVDQDPPQNLENHQETDQTTQKSKVPPEDIEIPVVTMSEFETIDMDNKLNLLMSAINKVNTNFHLKFESLEQKLTAKGGVMTKLSQLQDQYEEMSARLDDAEGTLAVVDQHKDKIDSLEANVEKIMDEVAALKGFSQVQDASLKECKSKIIDLTARSMANNVVIYGLMEDRSDEKDCRTRVLEFLRSKVNMEVQDTEIEVAHRLGGPTKNDKPRPIVVRCAYSLRSRIFNYTRNLKDVTNSQGDYYSIKSQLPEPLLSEKNDREERLRQIRKANDLIPDEEKHRRVPVHIKSNILYVNSIPQKQFYKPPTVQEVFNIHQADMERIDSIKIESSDPIQDKGSVFRGHAVKVKNSEEIRLAYKKLKLLYPESNHIMMSYSLKHYLGFCDDGEYGAGKKLQKIVSGNARALGSTALFVTREYGGFHLGQRRFLHIERAAKDALMKLYIP